MQNEEVVLFKQKAKLFFEQKKAVHIKFKAGHFKNGYIKEIKENFLVVKDFEDGEEFCFFLEMDKFDIYKPLKITKTFDEVKKND